MLIEVKNDNSKVLRRHNARASTRFRLSGQIYDACMSSEVSLGAGDLVAGCQCSVVLKCSKQAKSSAK